MEREVHLSIYQPPAKKYAKGGKYKTKAKHLGKRMFKNMKRERYRLTPLEREERKTRCLDCGWDKATEMYGITGIPLLKPRLCTRCYEKQVRTNRAYTTVRQIEFDQSIVAQY